MRLLKHDLFTAAIVTLHHVRVCTPSDYTRACGWTTICIWGLGHTQPHTQSFIPGWDIVHAASVLCGVITDGRVLVRTLRARQRKAVRSQKIIQILVTIAGWQWGTTFTALQREWETPKTRVPSWVCGGQSRVRALDNVKLRELLHWRSSKIVRVSRVHWEQGGKLD